MKTKTILILIFITLIVVFSLQNSNPINVSLFLWDVSISTVLLILSCFGLGLLVGILVSFKKKKPEDIDEYSDKNLE